MKVSASLAWARLFLALVCLVGVGGCETVRTSLGKPLYLLGAQPGDPQNVVVGFSKRAVVTDINGQGLELFRKSVDRVLYIALPPGTHRFKMRMYNGNYYSKDDTTLEVTLEPGKVVFFEIDNSQWLTDEERFGFIVREGGTTAYRPVPFRIVAREPVY